MPPFLDFIVQGYFNLRCARQLFDNPQHISVDTIFTYVSLEELFRDKADKRQLSEGLKLSIKDLIDFIVKPQRSSGDFVRLLRALI